MPIHPLKTTEKIRSSYLNYLKTIKPFQNETLREEFAKAIEEKESKQSFKYKVKEFLKNNIETVLLFLIVLGIIIGNLLNNLTASIIVSLAIPSLIGIFWTLFLNTIKLMNWLSKPKYVTFIKRFGKIRLSKTRNKDKVRDIEYYSNDTI